MESETRGRQQTGKGPQIIITATSILEQCSILYIVQYKTESSTAHYYPAQGRSQQDGRVSLLCGLSCGYQAVAFSISAICGEESSAIAPRCPPLPPVAPQLPPFAPKNTSAPGPLRSLLALRRVKSRRRVSLSGYPRAAVAGDTALPRRLREILHLFFSWGNGDTYYVLRCV